MFVRLVQLLGAEQPIVRALFLVWHPLAARLRMMGHRFMWKRFLAPEQSSVSELQGLESAKQGLSSFVDTDCNGIAGEMMQTGSVCGVKHRKYVWGGWSLESCEGQERY